MGSFDDLIPTSTDSPVKENAGSFSDLIPTSTDVSATAGDIPDETTKQIVIDARRNQTGIDRSKGVDIPLFRAGFSRTDTDSERADYLNASVGKGQWSIDSNGEHIILPEGLKRLGIEDEFARPIDEQEITVNDIADFAGDMPAILGGVGASMRASGMGIVQGTVLSAAGAGLGKGLDELVEYFQGNQGQTLGEVGGDVVKEAALGGTGEVAFRALGGIGKFALRPYARRISPERRALINEANDMGVIISPSQATDAPIFSRMEGLINHLFGNDAAVANSKAITKEVERLGVGMTGLNKEAAGEALKSDIKSARKSLSTWAGKQYDEIERLSGGQPFIPTQRLKDTAREMLEDLPKDMTGNVSNLSGPLARQLDNIINLEDTVTPNQMSKLLESFNSAIDDATLTPGVSGGAAKNLAKAADASFDDALSIGGDDAAKTLLGETRNEYGKRIREFDDAMVRRLTKPSSVGGAIDPEKAVDVLFRKGMHVKLKKMLNFASIETKIQLQDQAMDNVFKSFIKHGDDPFESIMNGTALRQTLDGYGETTLNVMFGKQKTKDLFRLARVTQLATNKKVGAGAIAVAGVALRPLKNIGLLAKFRILNKILRHPMAIKWLTVGIDAPKTRTGMAAMSRFATFVSLLAESDKSDLVGEQ